MGDPRNGIKKLLEGNENSNNRVRSNDLFTAEDVLANTKKIVDDLATVNLTRRHQPLPTITRQNDAPDKANRLNTISQAIIGMKEATIQGITTIVDIAVLDTIVHTPDGANIKGIDNYQLHEVIMAILDGDDRPTTKDSK